MKKIKLGLLVFISFFSIQTFAQTDSSEVPNDSLPEVQLDKSLEILKEGNNEKTAMSLQKAMSSVEKESKKSGWSLDEKMLDQIGTLKNMIPLAKTGGLKSDILQKGIGFVKMIIAYKRIEKMLGGSSGLLGNIGGAKKNMGLLGTAMSVLSPPQQTTGQQLLNTAMSGLGKLSGGGSAAKMAEPAVKGQVSKVLDFVKGAM